MMGESETTVRLAYAECLLAAHDIEAAQQVLERARDRILGRAGRLGPRANHAAFCSQVPHNAETLRLAEANLGPARAVGGEPQIRLAIK
jgi:thioredoxin-like negative regulator of GroEL